MKLKGLGIIMLSLVLFSDNFLESKVGSLENNSGNGNGNIVTGNESLEIYTLAVPIRFLAIE